MLHLTAHSIFSHILSIQFSHNQNAPNREPPTWYVQRPMRERVQCLCFEQQYIWFDSTLLTYTRYFAQSGEKHLLCRSYISPISILAIGSVLFNCISCVFFLSCISAACKPFKLLFSLLRVHYLGIFLPILTSVVLRVCPSHIGTNSLAHIKCVCEKVDQCVGRWQTLKTTIPTIVHCINVFSKMIIVG